MFGIFYIDRETEEKLVKLNKNMDAFLKACAEDKASAKNNQMSYATKTSRS